MLKKVLLLVAGLALGVSLFAETIGVAVLPAIDRKNNVEDAYKFSIRQYIVTGITLVDGYEAYDRINLATVLDEQKFQRDGMVKAEDIKKIGEMTGAQYVMIIETMLYPKDPDVIIVSAQFEDVETARIHQSATARVHVNNDEQMEEECKALAKKLLGIDGNRRPSQSGRVSFNSSDSQSNYTESAYGVNMKMVFVPGGEFVMGGTSEQGGDAKSDEGVIRRVTVGDFFIGHFEVTQSQWEAVMATSISDQRNLANPSWPLRGTGPDYPMYYVSWEEESEFCRVLSRKTGRKYSLPTEAEWEYAARGGQKSDRTKYAGSQIVDRVAWYDTNSSDTNHPVGRKAPNELDLYDMSGNVYEWCSDWYGDTYDKNDVYNPTGPASGSKRVIRGGSRFGHAGYCRVSDRNFSRPGSRYSNFGFRVVCRP